MNATDLLKLAELLRGQELHTKARDAIFRVDARPDRLEIIPSSSGKARYVNREILDQVCQRFESSGSLAPKDYHDITFDSSYLLTLIRRHRLAT